MFCLVVIGVGVCCRGADNEGSRKSSGCRNGEPMPLVSIVFVGTTIGVTTDFDGNYDIETREEVSEIMASFVSYERRPWLSRKELSTRLILNWYRL